MSHLLGKLALLLFVLCTVEASHAACSPGDIVVGTWDDGIYLVDMDVPGHPVTQITGLTRTDQIVSFGDRLFVTIGDTASPVYEVSCLTGATKVALHNYFPGSYGSGYKGLAIDSLPNRLYAMVWNATRNGESIPRSRLDMLNLDTNESTLSVFDAELLQTMLWPHSLTVRPDGCLLTDDFGVWAIDNTYLGAGVYTFPTPECQAGLGEVYRTPDRRINDLVSITNPSSPVWGATYLATGFGLSGSYAVEAFGTVSLATPLPAPGTIDSVAYDRLTDTIFGAGWPGPGASDTGLFEIDKLTGAQTPIPLGGPLPFPIGDIAVVQTAVTAVDPNPGDLDGGATPSRPAEKSLITSQGRILGSGGGGATVDQLATGGYPFEKVATDGITPILIRAQVNPGQQVRFRIEGPGDGDLSQGSLVPLGSSPLAIVPQAGAVRVTVPLPSQGTNTGYWAFAVWQAPAAIAAVVNPISIVAETTNTPTQELGRVQLTAVPPPVVLIHGIWSNAQSLSPLAQTLTGAGFEVSLVDYGSDGVSVAPLDIRVNRPVRRLDQVVRSTLRVRRRAATALTRVNVVAHSFGGLVTRMRERVLGHAYFRDETFGLGDVHKLITLDTPHLGSPQAALALTTCIGDWLEAQNPPQPIHNGGADDLFPGSGALTSLPPHPAFLIHTVAGYANGAQELDALDEVILDASVRRGLCGSCSCGSGEDCGDDSCAAARCADPNSPLPGSFSYLPCTLGGTDCPPPTVCQPRNQCEAGGYTLCRTGQAGECLAGGSCGNPLTLSADYLHSDLYDGEDHDISVGVRSSKAGRDSPTAASVFPNVVHSDSWALLRPGGKHRSVIRAPEVQDKVLDLLSGDENAFDHL